MSLPLHRSPKESLQSGVSLPAVMAILVVALLSLYAAAHLLAQSKIQSARDAWVPTLGTDAEIDQRFPAKETNEAALELERLADRVGVRLVPMAEVEARGWQRNAEHESFSSQKGKLYTSYLYPMMARDHDGSVPAPPLPVQQFLDRHRTSLEAIRDHLLRSETPEWRSEFSERWRAPLPFLLGHMDLHRVLALASIERLSVGDLHGGKLYLEASWQFSNSLRGTPHLINQLITLHINELQLAAVRLLGSDAGLLWADRLSEMAPRESVITALRFEGLVMLEFDHEAELAAGKASKLRQWAAKLSRPYSDYCVAEINLDWVERIDALSAMESICDDAEIHGEMSIEVPSWNRLDSYFSHGPSVLARVGRNEFDIELTRQILRLGSGEVAAVDGTLSSACSSDRWGVSPSDTGLSLSISRELRFPEEMNARLATQFTVSAIER